MRRFRPGFAVFALALLASLGVHLPVYEVLGVLADRLLHTPAPAHEPSVIEFEMAGLSEHDAEPDVPVDPRIRVKQVQPPEVKPPAPTPQAVAKPKPKLRLPQPVLTPPPPPAATIPPPEEEPNKLAVTQKSDDPEVDAPEDARFVADENRRVDQETVARVRNMHRDDTEPDPGTAKEEKPADAPGAGDETEVADLQEVKGDERRTADAREAQTRPEDASAASAGQRDAAAVPTPAVPEQVATAEQRAQQNAGVPETGGEPETVVIDDGLGTFVLHRPKVGSGPGTRGGQQPPGTRSAHRHARAGSAARTGANLNVSWNQFEQTFGEEKLRQERQAYVAQRKSKLQGSASGREWKKFRAAIENFVPNVKPGNQTALNAAASPFAAYLAAVHRRIHRTFAQSFLHNLPMGGGPYDDMSLRTKLEIIINGDGSLYKVGVVETSGFLPFDYGAFSSVQNAAPFSAPPRRILSGDGRVYVHWAFYRNHRQCGTFNASPFILPNPPGTPGPGEHSPFRDRPPDAEFGAAPAIAPDAPMHAAR